MAKAKKPKAVDVDYSEIYKNWDDYPDCRISIPGESLWGKQLPGGLIGIGNVPLSGYWMWQDIVRTKDLGESEEAVKASLVHRRWKHKLYFQYEALQDATDEELTDQRKTVFHALKSLGHPGFWSDGTAYLLIEQEDMSPQQCFENITKALAVVGVKTLSQD